MSWILENWQWFVLSGIGYAIWAQLYWANHHWLPKIHGEAVAARQQRDAMIGHAGDLGRDVSRMRRDEAATPQLRG